MSKRFRFILGILLALLALTAGFFWFYAPYPARQDFQPAASSKQILSTSQAPPQKAGYYDTVWPSEHADLWRSHAALNAGLPANFAPGQLMVATAPLNLPVWTYTRAKDEVFVIGGSPFSLNGFTQSIAAGKALDRFQSLASTAADLFNGTKPYLAKINPLTMQVSTLNLTEGTTVNYTGGLLMHQNGYVYAVAQSVLYKIDPQSMQIVQSLKLPLVGNVLEHYWTTYNGLQVLASGELVLKGFDILDSAKVPGFLLLVDPDDLQKDAQQQTFVSSARLTIQQSAGGDTYLYHVNATDSLRFKITNIGFELDSAWTRGYRAANAPSTQASSPLLFGGIGQVVFADNTAPGATTPLKLYTQPVEIGRLPETREEGTPAFSKSLPGFNFFMVAGDPFVTQLLIYYDPINNVVSAHRVTADGKLEPVWERAGYKVSASPALVPDRDLLYIDNYQNGRDHLVVLKLSTGEELASVELSATLPTIGTIVPGMNNDVYITSSETGRPNGLITRIYVP
jgi:hypothetical protein